MRLFPLSSFIFIFIYLFIFFLVHVCVSVCFSLAAIDSRLLWKQTKKKERKKKKKKIQRCNRELDFPAGNGSCVTSIHK